MDDDTRAEAHVFDLDDHDGDRDAALLSARASVSEGWLLLHIQEVDQPAAVSSTSTSCCCRSLGIAGRHRSGMWLHDRVEQT